MQITVSVDRVYGNRVIRPVCQQAKLLAELAGTKTLTPAALKIIRKMGYEVIQQFPSFA